MDENIVKIIEETIIEVLNNNVSATKEVPIGVSNRHIHLSRKAVELLFGQGYALQKLRNLSQPGQFACKESLEVIGPKGKLSNVRVLGPTRSETQVEISLNDGYILGVKPPIRNSGDIKETPSIILQGPKGQLKLSKGLICAARHIHMTPLDAIRFGVSDKDYIKIQIAGDRPITFDHTLVRVSPHYQLEMHIDQDEANAANIKTNTVGFIAR